MTHKDVFEPAFTFSNMKSVIDGQDRPAWVTKDGVNSMEPQGIHEGMRSSKSALTAPI
jgi:hypothetical protein